MAEHAGVERYLQTLERAKEEEQDAASQVRRQYFPFAVT